MPPASEHSHFTCLEHSVDGARRQHWGHTFLVYLVSICVVISRYGYSTNQNFFRLAIAALIFKNDYLESYPKIEGTA